jgi:hypothetical protein
MTRRGAAVDAAAQGGQVSAGGLLALALIVLVICYLFGVGRYGWRTQPADMIRYTFRLRTSDMSGRPDIEVSGHDVRRSEPVDTTVPRGPVDTSDPNVWGDLERMGWAVEPDLTREAVHIPRRRPTATHPAEVAVDVDEDRPPRKASQGERIAWLLAREQAGDPVAARCGTRGKLDAMAAELFDCDVRTIRRDRKAMERRRPTK